MQQYTFLGVPALSYGDDIPQGSHSGELLHFQKHLYGLCYHFRGNLSSLYIVEKLISNQAGATCGASSQADLTQNFGPQNAYDEILATFATKML